MSLMFAESETISDSECELICHKSFSNVTAYKKEHYPFNGKTVASFVLKID